MTLNDYQVEAFKATLGLEEVRDVQNRVKKILEGDKPIELVKEGIASDLGGFLWYVAMLAKEIDYTLEEIAQMNLEFLKRRMERGTIKGDGDEWQKICFKCRNNI